jgi:hypothetical protein
VHKRLKTEAAASVSCLSLSLFHLQWHKTHQCLGTNHHWSFVSCFFSNLHYHSWIVCAPDLWQLDHQTFVSIRYILLFIFWLCWSCLSIYLSYLTWLQIWTSTLQRTLLTARHIVGFPKVWGRFYFHQYRSVHEPGKLVIIGGLFAAKLCSFGLYISITYNFISIPNFSIQPCEGVESKFLMGRTTVRYLWREINHPTVLTVMSVRWWRCNGGHWTK